MPRMKLVNIVPDAPGLRAMPAVAFPAVRPWPIPQPRPASPTARPAPIARSPALLPAPPPSSANATSGARTTRKRLESTVWTSLRISVFLPGLVRWVGAPPLVRVLERLPDVDHREQREHEGLEHRHEQAQAHEERRNADRQQRDPDAHDRVICEHVRKKAHGERQDAREVEDQLERQEERRERVHVDVPPEEVDLEERGPEELVDVPEAVLADPDNVVGEEGDDRPGGGHVDVLRRPPDPRDEPEQVRDQDEEEDRADEREVAAPVLAHRVAREARERLDHELDGVAQRDPLVGDHAASRGGQAAPHQRSGGDEQERRQHRRLHGPRDVQRLLEQVVDPHGRSPASSSASRSRARHGSQRSHSGSSGASPGAPATTGGRWRHASMIAAGRISESPTTRPTGCAPKASALAIPTASTRKRSPATARKAPLPGISPPRKAAAERRRPRKFSDSSAAPATRLTVKSGPSSASERAAAPAESARFVLSMGWSLTSRLSSRRHHPGRRPAPRRRTRARAAPAAARTRRSRARGRRRCRGAPSRSGGPSHSRGRRRSRSRRPPRTRPDRRGRGVGRRSSARDAAPPPRPRRKTAEARESPGPPRGADASGAPRGAQSTPAAARRARSAAARVSSTSASPWASETKPHS